MRILITICARGGSKGIPGKNIKLLNGKPLISYSINTARLFQNAFDGVSVVISSDSDEILSIAADYGLHSDYRRPEYLGGDSVGKIDVIEDVLKFTEAAEKDKFDYVLDLDVTSPLRNLKDLTDAFQILKSRPDALNLFSVSPANRSPYFNMVEQKEDGFFSQVKKPVDMIFTRQSAPKVFDMNASFYFYSDAFFSLGYRSAITERSMIYVVPHICFDLDQQIDFDFISYLLANNKLDFIL